MRKSNMIRAIMLVAVTTACGCNPLAIKNSVLLSIKGGELLTIGVDSNKLSESIIIVRRRLDAIGAKGSIVEKSEDDQFIVKIPVFDKEVLEMVKSSLQSVSYLECSLTHPKNVQLVSKLLAKDIAPEGYKKSGNGYARAGDWSEVSQRPGYAARLAAFEAPDTRYNFMLEDNGDGTYAPNFVARSTEPRVTGEDLVSAAVQRDPKAGGLSIGFRLSSEGGRKFSTLTRNYKAHGPKNPTDSGRQLAIIVDSTLISALVINSEIGSSGQITGHFDAKSARKLAAELTAGALPAPLKVLSEKTIAPKYSIGMVIGALAVVCFLPLICLVCFCLNKRNSAVS